MFICLCRQITAASISVNSSGNVCFYNGGLTDFSQDGKPVRLDGGFSPEPDPVPNPQPDDDVITRDVVISMPAGTYLSQRDDSTWTGLTNICSLGRLQASGCAAVAATMVARIMENNASITTKNLYDWGVWGVSNGYPWGSWLQNDDSELTFTYSNATTAWSTAATIIFDEIMNDRPVIIWLKNDAINGTHFVVGYGLKAGASKQNLQYDQIRVYNPDRDGAAENGTLQDMMAFNLWKNFGSVRKAIPD